jgi:Transposase DDE domain group 1
MTECSVGKLEFQYDGTRAVEAGFDGGTIVSDAGIMLLGETARGSSILDDAAACFRDLRDPSRIEHTVRDMVGQRVVGLCAGYEDLNDHDTLRRDPVFATVVGKVDPTGGDRKREGDRGAALAGKSTLNRLELTAGDATAQERYCKIVSLPEEMERFFVRQFLKVHDRAPKRIVLDIDPTDVQLHGKQEDGHFNAHYKGYCYLPLYVFCGQFLLAAVQRPSDIGPAVGVIELLEQIIEQIRERWASVPILIRGDAGFSTDELMSWVEARKAGGERIDYLFGLAKNSRLLAMLAPQMKQAEALYRQNGETSRVFAELKYETVDTWSRARRVVGKAEHMEGGPNPRFVVTSMTRIRFDAQSLYEDEYCARGNMENCIKEQQMGLFSDRASSSSFRANDLRLWFQQLATCSCMTSDALGWPEPRWLQRSASRFAPSSSRSVLSCV